MKYQQGIDEQHTMAKLPPARRHWIAAALLSIVVALVLLPTASAARMSPGAAEDFDAAWRFIRDRYCFFPDGPEHWRRAREALRRRAAGASTVADRIRVLETLLDQLADPHSHLRTNLASSHRLVPHDVWGTRTLRGLRIEAVRSGGAAQAAGVRPGDLVLGINGRPALDVADDVRPKHSPMPDSIVDQWSTLVALAGTHDTPRVWRVRSGETVRTIEVDAEDRAGAPDHEPLVSTAVPTPGVGLIRIATFDDHAAVARFDAALDGFMDKRAVIIDVRGNRGGDTAIARPIMGRFVRHRAAYATMRRRDGDGLSEPWTEYVQPRGDRYAGRVVILVDRFSASMAEGFAMGMRTIADATLVGTRMAGLGAAVETKTLPDSGITIQTSTEPVYTVDGKPRWKIEPDVPVSVTALRTGAEEGRDAILEAGLREARRR